MKRTVELRTPPKASSGTSYASCSSSTPYGTPPSDLQKATTTPGPPPRSLLKVAIGNSLRNKALHEDVTIVAPPKRTGMRTSTPKVVAKVSKTSKSGKENQTPPIAEEPGTVKKAPQRKTVVVTNSKKVLSANSKTVVKSGTVRAVAKRSIPDSVVRPGSHVPATHRIVAPRVDVPPSRAASAKPTVKAAAKTGEGTGSQQTRAARKPIGQRLTPERPVKRKSLKTIVSECLPPKFDPVFGLSQQYLF